MGSRKNENRFVEAIPCGWPQSLVVAMWFVGSIPCACPAIIELII
jgi:hypothetical protein